jgi:hypothetical protein
MDRRNKSSNINIDHEVDNIFKRHKKGLSQKEFIDLRKELGDNAMTEKIMEAYLEEDNRVTKLAKKVARIFKEKYDKKQLPYHYLLEKLGRYKKKYNFSDAVFPRFQEIFEQELIETKSKEILIPSTKMMKILGYLDLDYMKSTSKSLSDLDVRSIQEIIKLNANPLFRDKHIQIIMQSHLYNKIEQSYGKFHPALGDSTTGPLVHPVIAALFINKIQILDTHFLYSNLANIVDCRYNNKPLQYITDIKLFNALIRDPNDILCNSASPYADLLARVKIQHCLWDNVLNLRQGKFYRLPAFSMLLQELELCNLLSMSEKSLMFGNTDGVILKRLLNAFSFRPTVIYHMPKELSIKVLFNANPYQQFIRPIVSNTSLIHLRPPMQLMAQQPREIKLSDALHQVQPVIENNRFVFKETHVTFSNGVLFFYVDRRQSKIYDTRLAGTTFSNVDLYFSSGIPYSIMNSYDTINNIEVEPEFTLPINNREYVLKSVVIAETLKLKTGSEVIVNSSTLYNNSNDYDPTRWYRYDPIGLNNNGSTVSNGIVIDVINDDMSIIDNKLSSTHLIKTKGIIYVYELSSDLPNSPMILP